tara:strand:+ start:1206 stop:1406 length:201 start_codon:yes stop_codon:yes gene_type:complete
MTKRKFYVFLLFLVLLAFGYQLYENKRLDEVISKEEERTNKIVQKNYRLYLGVFEENKRLREGLKK